jgi:hypothetical protein
MGKIENELKSRDACGACWALRESSATNGHDLSDAFTTIYDPNNRIIPMYFWPLDKEGDAARLIALALFHEAYEDVL